MRFFPNAVNIQDVYVIVPEKKEDKRGFFMETYKRSNFVEEGIVDTFVQDNHSLTITPGTIRGLHFQWDPPMSKLMRVTRGKAYLVAVDIRYKSPTFGQYIGIFASAQEGNQLYTPAGFARGFQTLEPNTEIQYKAGGEYNPEKEGEIHWNSCGIKWPMELSEISQRDANAKTLEEWEKNQLSPFPFHDND